MPSYPDFREPVRLMTDAVGPATDEQLQLAAIVGLRLANEPRAVTAALLQDHLQPAIYGTEPRPASDRQREFLHELGSEHAGQPDLTLAVASAWIDHTLTLRNIEQLILLQPSRDDAVLMSHVSDFGGQRVEMLEYKLISSVGANGLVYFKGGNGQCARPYRLTKALPSDDPADFPMTREVSNELTS